MNIAYPSAHTLLTELHATLTTAQQKFPEVKSKFTAAQKFEQAAHIKQIENQVLQLTATLEQALADW